MQNISTTGPIVPRRNTEIDSYLTPFCSMQNDSVVFQRSGISSNQVTGRVRAMGLEVLLSEEPVMQQNRVKLVFRMRQTFTTGERQILFP